ncbi:NAD(P)-dependent oxidoreductase [Allofustis seminis]|uniref:NAD(P)-dependent oxidoreductase n=1 Tax=Allofustis seminis TaxID=166939 RepID=UPI00035F3018|nr:NAD(P)-dependent oxidoreductase [Allofustis seminis]
MKKILLLFEMPESQRQELKKIAPEYEWTTTLVPSDDTVEIVYGWSPEFGTMLKDGGFKGVCWIQFPYAGVNQLPLALLGKRQIMLTNGSGIHTSSMTEVLFGHLLSYTRSFKKYTLSQQAHQWAYNEWSFDFVDKTMLVIGAGKIGQEVARVAKAFHMHVLGINRSGNKVENFEMIYPMKDLQNILPGADIVVNILPLTEETTHLYDSALFHQMKKGVLFVNMGRGQSVVTNDLVYALESGHVAFAGLDVFEQEPLPKDHPLWDMAQVSITPHIGGVVENYPKHIFAIFKENLKAYQRSQPLVRNCVDLKLGY